MSKNPNQEVNQMKKTKKIRYKRYVKAEDAYISTDGVVKRKELKDTYTDKEQR